MCLIQYEMYVMYDIQNAMFFKGRTNQMDIQTVSFLCLEYFLTLHLGEFLSLSSWTEKHWSTMDCKSATSRRKTRQVVH